MGYHLLYTKSTELWIRIKYRVTQVLRTHQEAVCVRIRTLTQESAVMAHYGHRVSVEQEELTNENAK